LVRGRHNHKFRDRRRQTLFIDARKMGHMVDRKHRELSDDDVTRIAGTYHAWRGEADADEYEDILGFCKSVATEEIATHNYVLTPGRYVGVEKIEEDGEPFEEKMTRLTAKLEEQFAESAKLESVIQQNLKGLGHG
jgi:type I restriction enzyme M protein